MGTLTLTAGILKNWRAICIALSFLVFVPLIAIFAPFAVKENTPELPEGGLGGKSVVSESVRRYEPLVRLYAAKYGVEGYTEILLAKMMQESGGRLPDVMQSSESIGLPPNTITDPEVSIDVGVRYFSGIIKKANGDIKLALQSYNFGSGFIDFALARGGYSKENAVAFSNKMAAKLGWSGYGDINYVEHVMRYFSGTPGEAPEGGTQAFKDVMNVALQFQGMPYQWAGSSPSTSFDCSGLWQYSFKQIGINLPRTAAEQYNFTERISKGQLQPGDFIFFTGTADHNYISHVGLYVGGGKMYNSNSKGVVYSDLKGYWNSHVAGYGRLRGIN